MDLKQETGMVFGRPLRMETQAQGGFARSARPRPAAGIFPAVFSMSSENTGATLIKFMVLRMMPFELIEPRFAFLPHDPVSGRLVYTALFPGINS